MQFLKRLSIILFCVAPIISILTSASNDDSDSASHSSDWLEVNDSLDISAIKELHARLDDDKDGKVDSLESEEFAREELNVSEQDGRSWKFHKEDEYITNDELLRKWKNSKVYDWSVDDVEKWLVKVVNLPELVSQFRYLHITGRFLPWIATNREEVMAKLDIKGTQKKKLILRATDAVLFGPPEIHHAYWKDAVVVLSVTFCVVAITMAWRQQVNASAKLDSFLEEIKYYEKELSKLRSKIRQAEANSNSEKEAVDSDTCSSLDKTASDVTITNDIKESEESDKEEEEKEEEKEENENGDSHVAEVTSQSLSSDEDISQENETLKLRIWSLETQLKNMTTQQQSLRELLLQSSQQEWYYLDAIKKTAEDDVVRAQKVCDKIKKRRGSMLGAFRLANSSTLEDAGLLITKAVNKMQDITEDFEEYHARWKKIEQICGFPIITGSHSAPSTTMLPTLNSVAALYTQSTRKHSKNSLLPYGYNQRLQSEDITPTTMRSTSLPGDLTRRRHNSHGDIMGMATPILSSHVSAPSSLNNKYTFSDVDNNQSPGHSTNSTKSLLKKQCLSSSSLGVIREIKPLMHRELEDSSSSLDLDTVLSNRSPGTHRRHVSQSS